MPVILKQKPPCSFDIDITKNLNEREIDGYLLQFEKIVRKLRDAKRNLEV